jgi:hypothetical protein
MAEIAWLIGRNDPKGRLAHRKEFAAIAVDKFPELARSPVSLVPLRGLPRATRMDKAR